MAISEITTNQRFCSVLYGNDNAGIFARAENISHVSLHRRRALTMTDSFINKIIRDEIDNMNALDDSDKNIIYALLDIERYLSSTGKTSYMKDYKKAMEDAAGAGYR